MNSKLVYVVFFCLFVSLFSAFSTMYLFQPSLSVNIIFLVHQSVPRLHFMLPNVIIFYTARLSGKLSIHNLALSPKTGHPFQSPPTTCMSYNLTIPFPGHYTKKLPDVKSIKISSVQSILNSYEYLPLHLCLSSHCRSSRTSPSYCFMSRSTFSISPRRNPFPNLSKYSSP